MNPSSTVPDKVKGIQWNLAQRKNAGQSIIALLLAKSNVRNDKEHSAPVLSDKVIWWRQMVELAASLVAENRIKTIFPPQGMDYDIWESSLETVTHWTDLEPPHMGRSSFSLATDPQRSIENYCACHRCSTLLSSPWDKNEEWMLKH